MMFFKSVALAMSLGMMSLSVKAGFLPQAPASAFIEVASEHGIQPELLYAIALRESGHTVNQRFQPHPYALGIGYDLNVGQLQHEGLYPETLVDAQTTLTRLLDAGYRNMGIGLMQINIGANRRIIDDPLQLLDPAYNLTVASKVLRYCQSIGSDAASMLSCYRTGSTQSDAGLAYAKEVATLQAQYAPLFFARYMPSGRMTLEQLKEYQRHRAATLRSTPQ